MNSGSVRDEALRFVALIDTLYDSAGEAGRLRRGTTGRALPGTRPDGGDALFEFERVAVSRLIEMRSEAYLALPHGGKDSAASGSSTGLVET